jgi:hypothetical protein
MHGELESLTTGTRYRALNRQMKRIDDVRVAQGVPELPAGDDIADGSDDDALLELEPDEG